MKQENKNQTTVRFFLNGNEISRTIRNSLLLIDFIRDELELNGTKPGCNEGECGACAVLIDGVAINSCLYLAINLEGKSLTTIEGMSSEKGLGEIQEKMIEKGAVQCGFCSSGMTISIKSMQTKYSKSKKGPSELEIKKGLEGNLCRCTGYTKIIEAADSVLNEA